MQLDADLRREATGIASNWWLFLVTGLAWLLIGVLVLRFNITSVATVGILLGAMFLGAAANEFLASTTVPGAWKFLHVALGVLFVLGSLWGFFRPINTAFAFASVLGFLLVLSGAIHIVMAVMSKETYPLWGFGLAVGILEVLLAIWVSQQYYDTRIALILIWVGLMAIFRGIGEIVLAFHLHHVRKRLQATA